MIGLIFGENELPKEILRAIKNKNIKYIIIDLTNKNLFKKDKNSHKASIGEFGKIIKILKQNNCKKVLFAGNVKKPNFTKLKVDLKGFFYLPRLIKKSKLGDAAILKEIIKILLKERIKTLSSLFFTPKLSLKKGTFTKIKPNSTDHFDIKKSIKVLNTLGRYNFSQGIVVRNKKIISIEGKDGTKSMLKKLKSKNKKNEGVLVKFPKKGQDLRIDLPTIGKDTLKQCKLAKIKGIVLKENKNIVLNKSECISMANKNKMFITVY